MRCHDRRGIMLMDAVLGIALLTAVAVLLSATVARHGKATDRLAGSRAALRAAERVMSDLQLGQTPAASDQRTRWDVRPLDAPAAPRGQAWVQVRVVHRGREATLVGVVPASAVEGAAP